MAASLRGQDPGPTSTSAQVKIDLLLVGDVTIVNLADTVQKLFSSTAEVTVTVSDVKKVAAFLDECTFNMVFLKMTSLPITEELEAVKLIRFAKKKNIHLLFVFLIPENFEDCISGHGADIILTEPLTMEKMSILVNYWKAYFSKTVKSENVKRPEEPGSPPHRSYSEQLGHFSTDLVACSNSPHDTELELKSPLSDLKKNQKSSRLHSNKEKLRRERIKDCCEQLRTLLPYRKGRKNDVASILEATVDYVKDIREKIPPAVMAQITEELQNNRRFSKKQQEPSPPSLPDTVVAHRENSVLVDTCSPVTKVRLLAGEGASEFSVPAVGCSGDSTETGHVGSPSDHVALSLNSFHAALPVRCYSEAAPSPEATAVTSQNISVHFPSVVPRVSKFLPQHCSSVLGQTCSLCPDCLQQFQA
ncbi:spermatogenesis- and oogenesis-specific basic helix-loop-helix-containing protein 2 [Elephas maximus indicus]|uniref:spermatogenesis- and oogenesis-specific basic helix-loop-helix-containing protein 2 n=1 Tax=Elephas maximus indicus TaxID=99487 RepID=UPI0021172020|nr:spermatogenesis- and oogenesis-specific basic helix-loop-helix-containing protein 2 [Elephas maximus indicus]